MFSLSVCDFRRNRLFVRLANCPFVLFLWRRLNERKTRPRSYALSINGVVDKEHHSKSLKEIIKCDVSALVGIGDKQKEVTLGCFVLRPILVVRAFLALGNAAFFCFSCVVDARIVPRSHDRRAGEMEILPGTSFGRFFFLVEFFSAVFFRRACVSFGARKNKKHRRRERSACWPITTRASDRPTRR
jgi:hypothetical protein